MLNHMLWFFSFILIGCSTSDNSNLINNNEKLSPKYIIKDTSAPKKGISFQILFLGDSLSPKTVASSFSEAENICLAQSKSIYIFNGDIVSTGRSDKSLRTENNVTRKAKFYCLKRYWSTPVKIGVWRDGTSLNHDIKGYQGGILVRAIYDIFKFDPNGIQPMDLILSINEKKMEHEMDFVEFFSNHDGEQIVKVKIIRNRKELDLKMRLIESPEVLQAQSQYISYLACRFLKKQTDYNRSYLGKKCQSLIDKSTMSKFGDRKFNLI